MYLGVIAVIRINDLFLAIGECAKGDSHYGIFKTGLDLVPQKDCIMTGSPHRSSEPGIHGYPVRRWESFR